MSENTPLESVGAPTPAAFDASALELTDDASVEVEIIDPKTNTSTGIFITVYSAESEKGKAVTRAQINRRFKGLARRNGSITLTAEENEAEELDMLVSCTKNWRDVNWAGKPLACNAENARFLYTRVPVIRKQVRAAVYDDSLFTRG